MSGRWELNPVYLLPKQAYYRYTTARCAHATTNKRKRPDFARGVVIIEQSVRELKPGIENCLTFLFILGRHANTLRHAKFL